MGGISKENVQRANGGDIKRKSLLDEISEGTSQSVRAAKDMYKEYQLMKSHGYKDLDDYYHCKANIRSLW